MDLSHFLTKPFICICICPQIWLYQRCGNSSQCWMLSEHTRWGTQHPTACCCQEGEYPVGQVFAAAT